MSDPYAAHSAFLTAQLASLPPLPPITPLSPRVTRILGGNPGKFTLQGTNTYLLGTSTPRILIDTGATHPPWRTNLTVALGTSNISTVLLTHHHADHTGGVPSLESLTPFPAIHKHTPDPGQAPITDGQEFSVEGATVRALWTPGHTRDHMCFYLVEENAVFTGDTVLGHGTTVFEDLGAYMGSLETLQGVNAARLYPGHGEVVEDAEGKIREYVRHRKVREGQVVKVLEAQGGAGVTSMGIVKTVYKGLGEELYLAAERGVVLVLVKLEGEGKVRREGEGEGEEVRWFWKESRL